jgi:hypothetical protein
MPMPRKKDPVKHCQQCRALMSRKVINRRIEDMRVFRSRKYCDRACMARAFMKIDPGLSALRMRQRGLRGDACEVCRGTNALSLHHMDENPRNDDLENIRTLCNSCHQLWHWHFGKERPKSLSTLPNDTAPTDCEPSGMQSSQNKQRSHSALSCNE